MKALEQLDRRFIYLAMALVVLVPLIRPARLPLSIGSPAQKFHAAIEALPKGAVVVMPFDYEPGAMAEVHPMGVAVLRRLLQKGVRVIAVTMQPAGPPMADQAWAAVGPPLGKTYGVDFVNLGYKSGNEALVLAMGTSIPGTFPTDSHGAPVASLPIMKGVEKLGDADMIVEIAGTVAANIWVQQATARYHVPMVAGITGVLAPEFFPYMQAGLVKGMLGGMAGAAEYETLVGVPGSATKGMDAQSLAHFLIIVLILIGNLLHLASRRKATAVLLLCVLLAGCSSPAKNPAGGAAKADTVRDGKALVATFKDGPVRELRLVRDTSNGIVVWGETSFPEGTRVRAVLLTGEDHMLAATGAQVALGVFSSQPLVPSTGPLAQGLVRVRVEASFADGAQTDSILAVTDRGRRFHGNGMAPAGDHADWRITMEAPL